MRGCPLTWNPSMRTPLRLLTALVLLAVAAPASADSVTLKDGTVITGTILSKNDKQVVIETAELGAVPLAIREIARIERVEQIGDGDGVAKKPAVERPTADDKPVADEPPAADTGTLPDLGSNADEPDEEWEAPPLPSRFRGRRAFRLVKRPTKSKDGPKAGDAPETPETTDTPESTDTPETPEMPEVPETTDTPETAETPTPKATDEPADDLGGDELREAQPGTTVLVVYKPTQFEPAEEAIEFGRRILADVHVMGVNTGWVSLPMKEGPKRISVRLDRVERHSEVTSASSRALMLEGVSPGDWIRIRLTDGSTVQGRLAGYSAGSIQYEVPEMTGSKGRSTRRSVSVLEVVELDGIQRSIHVYRSLSELQSREPVAITLWPTGEEIVGRVTARNEIVTAIDVDNDRVADRWIHDDMAVAAVRRIPVGFRDAAEKMESGYYARVDTTEEYPDALVDRVERGRVVGLTAYAVCLEEENGVRVLPFGEVTKFQRLEGLDRRMVEEHSADRDPARVSHDLPVLPGEREDEAAEVDESTGVSTLGNGRNVTHVFISAPFEGSVFGLHIGDDAKISAKDCRLAFDTFVHPKPDPEGSYRAPEMVCDVVTGMRVTLLLDPKGAISAIELSARD